MFTDPLRRAAFPLACCALLASCGDDDGGRPRYRVDVDGDVATSAPVSSLDDAQLERVCESRDVYVETYVSFEAIAYIACLPPAIVLGGTEEGCSRRLADCMELFPEPIEVRATVESTELCVEQLRQCDDSIADLEGCVNVSLDLVLDIIDNWSCRGLDDDRIAEAARAMDTVSVCAMVDSPCAEAVAFGPD